MLQLTNALLILPATPILGPMSIGQSNISNCARKSRLLVKTKSRTVDDRAAMWAVGLNNVFTLHIRRLYCGLFFNRQRNDISPAAVICWLFFFFWVFSRHKLMAGLCFDNSPCMAACEWYRRCICQLQTTAAPYMAGRKVETIFGAHRLTGYQLLNIT